MYKNIANKNVIEGIPYQSLFDRWIRVEKWANIFIWITGILSLVSVFWIYVPLDWPVALKKIILVVNPFAIVIGIALTWGAKICSGPVAGRERIGGFIDDAFETKILEKPINHYYTNVEIEKGTKRMAANCFENCFFTESISSKMTIRIILKNIIATLLFIVIGMINLNVETITASLQFLMSSVLLEELFVHWKFRRAIHELFERFKILYDTMSPDDEKFQAQATYMVIIYEKFQSYYNQPLNSKIYRKLKSKLSDQWEEMKKRYNILSETLE